MTGGVAVTVGRGVAGTLGITAGELMTAGGIDEVEGVLLAGVLDGSGVTGADGGLAATVAGNGVDGS